MATKGEGPQTRVRHAQRKKRLILPPLLYGENVEIGKGVWKFIRREGIFAAQETFLPIWRKKRQQQDRKRKALARNGKEENVTELPSGKKSRIPGAKKGKKPGDWDAKGEPGPCSHRISKGKAITNFPGKAVTERPQGDVYFLTRTRRDLEEDKISGL